MQVFPEERVTYERYYCIETYHDFVMFQQHLVSHAELRPYVCEYCDAGFTRAQALQFHLNSHTQVCGMVNLVTLLNVEHYCADVPSVVQGFSQDEKNCQSTHFYKAQK